MFLSKIKNIVLLALCLSLYATSASAERTTTYFHSDGVGSIVAASDENGDLLWRKQYQPFGTQIEGSNTSESISFTGKQHDDTTGLTYFGARYYDPMLARFVSTDPVSPLAGVGGSPYFFNRYAYANNNPYRYLDPDGQAAFLVPIIIFLAKEGTAEIASRYTNGATDFLSFRRLGTKSIKLGIRTYKDKTGKLSDTTKKKTDDGGASTKKTDSSETSDDQERVFHRRNDSQENIEKIKESGELVGNPPKNFLKSDIPKVNAIDGPLPKGQKGFEFTTPSKPDSGGRPNRPTFSGNGHNPTVETRDGQAVIKCTVTKVQC